MGINLVTGYYSLHACQNGLVFFCLKGRLVLVPNARHHVAIVLFCSLLFIHADRLLLDMFYSIVFKNRQLFTSTSVSVEYHVLHTLRKILVLN